MEIKIHYSVLMEYSVTLKYSMPIHLSHNKHSCNGTTVSETSLTHYPWQMHKILQQHTI